MSVRTEALTLNGRLTALGAGEGGPYAVWGFTVGLSVAVSVAVEPGAGVPVIVGVESGVAVSVVVGP